MSEVSFETMRVSDACEAFGLNPPNVYRWIKEEGLGERTSTGRIHLRKEDIDTLIELSEISKKRSLHANEEWKSPSKSGFLEIGYSSGDGELLSRTLNGRYDDFILRVFFDEYGKRLKSVPSILRWWMCAWLLGVRECYRDTLGVFFFSLRDRYGLYFDMTRKVNETFIGEVDEERIDKVRDLRLFEDVLGLREGGK